MESDILSDTSLTLTPVSQDVIEKLYSLSCTGFNLEAFRQRWQEFGWSYVPTPLAEYGFSVQITEELALRVGPEGNSIGCAYLSFCHWEQYERGWHDAEESYKAEKKLYGAFFDEAVEAAQQALGRSWYVGQDQDEDAHRYAVWRGDTSLLILQQCSFDTQFGLEINFWLEPVAAEDFQPDSPLIDWLTRRH